MASGILERILAIVSEGLKLGTHKLALLLAILDACVEGSDEHGRPPSRLDSADLARRVLALHWRHTLPFTRADGSEIALEQVRRGRRGRHLYLQCVDTIRKHSGADTDAAMPFEVAIRRARPTYEGAVKRVEAALIRDPIVRLQKLGKRTASFLYEPPLRSARSCTLSLLEGVPDELIRFSSVLRPIIEFEFAREVARINDLDQEHDRLLSYLFGSPRPLIPAGLRAELLDLQGGRCFYSGERLSLSGAQADHFIPWSRHALSTVENIVLARGRENSSKSNHLAAAKFVLRWAERLRVQRADLQDVARRYRLQFEPRRSVAIAASLYRHIEPDAPLWSGSGSFELARPGEILLTLRTALAGG